MIKIASKIAIAAAIGFLTFGGGASAQGKAEFDARKFFEEIDSRGVNTKGIDGNKFFEEISSRGVSSKEMFDGKKWVLDGLSGCVQGC
jgi:hypothetical protein